MRSPRICEYPVNSCNEGIAYPQGRPPLYFRLEFGVWIWYVEPPWICEYPVKTWNEGIAYPQGVYPLIVDWNSGTEFGVYNMYTIIVFYVVLEIQYC